MLLAAPKAGDDLLAEARALGWQTCAGASKEELSRAQDKADSKAEEVANLERKTA